MKRIIVITFAVAATFVTTTGPAFATPSPRFTSANAYAPESSSGCGFDDSGSMVASGRNLSTPIVETWTYTASSCLVTATTCPKSYTVCYEESGTVAIHTPSGDFYGTFIGIGDAGYTYQWTVTFVGGTGTWQGARGRADVTGGRTFSATVSTSSSWSFSGLRPS